MRKLWGVAVGGLLLVAGCKSHPRLYTVASGSMAPLLQMGDKVVVSESADTGADLHDGEVVALRHGDYVVLKRVLALPGETVSMQDRKLFRDGKEVAEPYLAPASGEEVPESMVTFAPRVVPAGEVFVLGDNRDRSLDSRQEEYGPVRLGDVIGKYRWTYWVSPVNSKEK